MGHKDGSGIIYIRSSSDVYVAVLKFIHSCETLGLGTRLHYVMARETRWVAVADPGGGGGGGLGGVATPPFRPMMNNINL